MHHGGVQGLDPLVQRYLVDGDEAAIETVVARTRSRLRRIAARIAGKDSAEDCVQTAYLSLLHKRGAGLDAPAWPWLVTAVVRLAYRRKAQARRQVEIAQRLGTPTDPEDPHDPLGTAIRKEQAQNLRARIAELRPSYRDVLVLRDLRGLCGAETAALLDITEANVRKRHERARAALRSKLHPRVASVALWLVPGEIMLRKIAVVAVLVLAVAGGGYLWHARRSDRAAERSDRHVSVAENQRKGKRTDGDVSARDSAPPPLRVPDGPHVTGRVLSPSGEPVAGARVVVSAKDIAVRMLPSPSADGLLTDALGRFVAPLSDDADTFTLFASADGFGPGRKRPVHAGDVVDVLLRPDARLTGIVMDLERTPVSGARVTWVGQFDGVVVEREAVTDAEGRYKLRGLPSPAEFEYRRGNRNPMAYVRAEGFAPLIAELGEPGGERHLIVERGYELTVRVIDVGQNPVSGARVSLRTIDRWPSRWYAVAGSLPSPHHLVDLMAGTTGVDGVVVFAQAPAVGLHDLEAPSGFQPGRMLLVVDVRAEGFVHATPTTRQFVSPAIAPPSAMGPPAGGRKLTEVVTLLKAGTVTGRLVDETGQPVANTRVVAHPVGRQFFSQFRREWPEGRTDADGHFAIDGVPESRVMLFIDRPVDTAVISVSSWDAGRLVVQRSDTPVVWFHVVDESGNPIEGASIDSTVSGGSGGPVTGADGRVRMRYVATIKKKRVVVRAKGYAQTLTDEFEPRPGDGTIVRVTLKRGGKVSGTVRWAEGKPAEGAWVHVFDAATDPQKAFGQWPPPGARYGMARVGADGSFEIADVPPGPYHYRAGWYEFPGTMTQRTIENTADTTVDLRFERDYEPAPIASIQGVLIDKTTGLRIPVAQITCVMNRGFYRARFLEPGRFRYAPVAPGTYHLTIRAAGFPIARHEVTVKGRDEAVKIRVELGRGGSVEGTVRIAGTLAENCSINIGGKTVRSGKQGRYRIDNVPPGIHEPTFFLGRAAAGFPKVEVREGSVATLHINTVRAGELKFRKQRRNVELRDAAGGVLSTRKYARGSWWIPPGKYRLATGDWSVEVEVSAGGQVLVD